MSVTSKPAEIPLLQQPFRTPKDAGASDVASFLVILTAAIMEDHTTSTYDILQAHCHPDLKMVDYTSHECGLPQAKSLQEHLSNVEALKRAHHNFQVNPFNFAVTFYGDSSRAIVWFTARGTEMPGDWVTNRESVHRVHWRRRQNDDVWEVHMHSGLRGPGNLFLQSNDPGMETKDVPFTHSASTTLFTENELAR